MAREEFIKNGRKEKAHDRPDTTCLSDEIYCNMQIASWCDLRHLHTPLHQLLFRVPHIHEGRNSSEHRFAAARNP